MILPIKIIVVNIAMFSLATELSNISRGRRTHGNQSPTSFRFRSEFLPKKRLMNGISLRLRTFLLENGLRVPDNNSSATDPAGWSVGGRRQQRPPTIEEKIPPFKGPLYTEDEYVWMSFYRMMNMKRIESKEKLNRAIRYRDEHFHNSSVFELGHLICDFDYDAWAIYNMSAILTRQSSKWDPIEHIAAYEEIKFIEIGMASCSYAISPKDKAASPKYRVPLNIKQHTSDAGQKPSSNSLDQYKYILDDMSWKLRLSFLNNSIPTDGLSKGPTRRNGGERQDWVKAARAAVADDITRSEVEKEDRNMKVKLFRLMYETVRDCEAKVKRAELIKNSYANSSVFEIGYLMGELSDKNNIMQDIAKTLKRLFHEWKPIEHINAYEQITNLALDVGRMVDKLKLVQKKIKDNDDKNQESDKNKKHPETPSSPDFPADTGDENREIDKEFPSFLPPDFPTDAAGDKVDEMNKEMPATLVPPEFLDFPANDDKNQQTVDDTNKDLNSAVPPPVYLYKL